MDAANSFRFHRALQILWDRIRDLNREIESTRPWDLLKQGKESDLNGHLSAWVANIRAVAHGLTPFLPETAENIQARFSSDRITQCDPLFPRLSAR